jgi:hypothetical protein
MKPKDMEAVIGGKRYSTHKAALIADDAHWDGHNHERQGRNTFLYRTARGNFFLVRQTYWQGEHDRIEPINSDEAVRTFESMSQQHVPFEKAFPTVPVEEA